MNSTKHSNLSLKTDYLRNAPGLLLVYIIICQDGTDKEKLQGLNVQFMVFTSYLARTELTPSSQIMQQNETDLY